MTGKRYAAARDPHPGCTRPRSDALHTFESETVRRHLSPRIAAARRRGFRIGMTGSCDVGDVVVSFRADDLHHGILKRSAHLSEGTALHRSHLIDTGAGDAGTHFERFIDEIEALLAEDERILEQGGDPEMPGPEHVRIHPLIAHVLRRAGVTADQLLDYDVDAHDRPIHITHGLGLRNIALGGSSTGIMMSHYLRNRMIMCNMNVDQDGRGTSLALIQEDERATLVVPNGALPETVRTAMPGMSVAGVVAHPLLRDAPCAIVRTAMTWSGDELALELVPTTVTIQQAWRER